MDDGLIDVRILETGRRLARPAYWEPWRWDGWSAARCTHEIQAPEFSFTAVDGPTPLAHDGEVTDDHESVSFTALYRILPVFRP